MDIDIKNSIVAPIAKKILEKLLFKYHWVHSIALSTSKNGLHIYTYTKPIEIIDDSEFSQALMKEYYLDVFEYKMMVVWKALHMTYDILLQAGFDQSIAKKVHPIIHANDEDVLDSTSARLSQPLIITADKTIKFNKETFSLEETILPEILTLYANVDSKYKMDILKNSFDRIRNRYGAELVDGIIQYADNHEFDNSFKDKIVFEEAELSELLEMVKPMHYDNGQRYRMAYTLAYLFDIKERNSDRYNAVQEIFMKLCSGNPKFHREKRQWKNAFKSAVDRNINNNCPCIYSSVNELRKVHGFNISIEVNKEEVNEQINNANTDDKITQHILTDVDYNPMFKLNYTHIFNIANNEYIGHHSKNLIKIIQHGVNLLDAPPGFGKTEFIKEISKKSRVMLVEPYTSIISSKIENSDLGFECFYGDKPLSLGNSKNVALTYDKFTKIDVDEVSMMFDYVAIDESHLLTMSSYRDTVPADVIDKVNLLKTKVILMTGTHVSEHLFMPLKSIIKFSRPHDPRNKNMNFVICQSNGDKLTKIAIHIANAIRAGKKVLFPTNKGDEYQERITASVRAFYGSKINYKYYKKDNQYAEFVDGINNAGTVGGVDLLFCSNFLSVGVDINDLTLFDVIYDEQFTAQEIEQFNCRLRKLNIESYYYFSKTDSQGNPKNITQYEDLNLELTTDEVASFSDIKKLHLQSDSSEIALFDFFKYAFSVPYFIKDKVSGEVHVHNMCFRLHKFEDKWREWAIQLNVVSTFLKGFGYTCDVMQEQSEDEESISLAIESSKEAGREYKKMKQSLTSQLMKLSNDEKIFQFILDVKHENMIDSDKFDIVKKKGIPTLLVADNAIFKTWRHVFRVMSRYYTRESIFDIIDEYCFKKDAYNISATNRIIDALRVIQNTEDDNLVDSNIFIVDKIVNDIFNSDVNETLELSKEDIDIICMGITSTYLKHSADFAESFMFKLKIEQLSQRIFKALTIKVSTGFYKLIELPPFDAPMALQRNKSLSVIMSLFGDSVDMMEAKISRNEMGKTLAENMKEGTQLTEM